MPNILAYAMLMLWPVVTLVLFRLLSPGRALVVSLVAGYLLLPPSPAGIDLPLLPPFGKSNIPGLSAVLAVFLLHRGRFALLPPGWGVRLLLLAFVLAPVPTWLSNTDPVFFGRVGLPGMRPFEALALVIQQAMVVLTMLLARALLSAPGAPDMPARDDGSAGLRVLAGALFVGGLAYSLPLLLEVRLSPQLNNWIYGYFQHDFSQTIRGGGYRPLVFLNHGLWAAFFVLSALVAGLALWRAAAGGRRGGYLLGSGWLALVLVASKSLGALILGVLAAPVVLLLGARWQLRLALLLGLLAAGYPLAKAGGLVPRAAILEQVERLSEERARSLRFRFDNEDVLLARAAERPAFGWGIWGRNQILDPVSGNFLTVTDGRWIITLGVYGWLGYIGEFGLLLWPLWALWRAARRRGAVPVLAGGLALLHGLNMVDLIPNATLTPITWLIAGALLGVAERLRLVAPEAAPAPAPQFRTVL